MRPSALTIRRAALLAGLALLGLGCGLGMHLWRTRQAVRVVSPLPLHAPGYTQDDGTGAAMRVIPLAGARLRGEAAPAPDGERPPDTAQHERTTP